MNTQAKPRTTTTPSRRMSRATHSLGESRSEWRAAAGWPLPSAPRSLPAGVWFCAVLLAVLAVVAAAIPPSSPVDAAWSPVARATEDVKETVSGWLLQGMPNRSVDAFVDGRQVGSDLTYGDVASLPSWAPSIGRHLEIRDSADGSTLISAPLDALTNGDYSLVLLPPITGSGAPRLTLFQNKIPDVPEGSLGWLAVRNVDLFGPVDLRVNGEIVATDIARSSGVLVKASGWIDVAVVREDLELPLGFVEVLPGRATIGHVIGTIPKSAIWQTLLVTSTQDALDTQCAGHRVSVVVSAGHEPTEYSDVILGTEGDDQIFAGAGDDIICAGSGSDMVRGQDGNDTIFGGPGADMLRGSDGADHLDGGPGADDLNGGRGDDVVIGGPGDDTALRGGTDDDFVDGGPGNDVRINGNGGEDVVSGGSGNDPFVYGGPRRDQLYGGTGDDVMRGLGGPDHLFGGAGDDELYGGAQNDFISGGAGVDSCSGGAGTFDAVECSGVSIDSPEITVEPPAAALRSVSCEPDAPLELVAKVTCWELTVPADYASPGSSSTMTVAVRRATRGRGAVPLLVLDGDLEAVETPFVGGLTGLVGDAGAPLDLIMVDLRGTGKSKPSLDCPEVDRIKIPAKSVGYRSAQASIIQAEEACARRLRDRAIDFGLFNAASSSRDLESLRQLLRIPRWNIWAAGPGTLVAQTLTRSNPDSISKVILQSAMGFGDDFLGARTAHSEDSLLAIEEACAADRQCGDAFPTLHADRAALYNALSQSPEVMSAVTPSVVYPVAVDGDRFLRELLTNVVQTEGGPGAVPELIDAGLGDLSATTSLGELSASYGTVRSEGALLASLCQDQLLLARANQARCAPWVVPNQLWTDPTSVEWPVPTLIISGAFDPITPASWGSRLAKSSSLGVDVVFEEEGTGMVSGGCVDNLVRTHLAGKPLDVSCRLGDSSFGP